MTEPNYALVTDSHREYVRKNRFPTCDTCGEPAVFNESFGVVHSTDECPFGLPPFRDISGHEASTHKWWSERSSL